MIKEIALDKFKSFEQLDSLEIKPITILCGANSSGKSSVIKSILSLKQSYESESARNNMIMNGKYVNNGNMKSVIYNGIGDCFALKNTFVLIKARKDRYDQDNYAIKMIEKIFKKMGKLRGNITIDYEIKFSKVDTDNSRKKNDSIMDLFKVMITTSYQDRKDIISKIELSRHQGQEFNYNLIWEEVPTQFGKLESNKLACTCYFSGLQLVNIYAQNNDYSKIFEVISNITTVFQVIAHQYKQISYLGPLREEPARNYIFESDVNEIGIKGENAPFIFYSEDFMMKGNEYILKEDKFVKNYTNKSFREHVLYWLDYIGIENMKLGENNEIINLIVENDNIVDVGFGVSQAFPIIVEGIRINKNSTLILEQPEIHLHPKMQMKIADFFISMALSGKQIIIETHSDHMINRFVRRIMEDEKNNLNDMIGIHFISKKEKRSEITKINVDNVKGIVSWPKDFFDQYNDETEKIIDIGFSNLKKKIEQE